MAFCRPFSHEFSACGGICVVTCSTAKLITSSFKWEHLRNVSKHYSAFFEGLFEGYALISRPQAASPVLLKVISPSSHLSIYTGLHCLYIVESILRYCLSTIDWSRYRAFRRWRWFTAAGTTPFKSPRRVTEVVADTLGCFDALVTLKKCKLRPLSRNNVSNASSGIWMWIRLKDNIVWLEQPSVWKRIRMVLL